MPLASPASLARALTTFASAVVLLVLTASAPTLAHARTWTDTQGRTLEADYVSTTTAEVTLRRADNRTFTLALALLSADDRAFIAQQSSTLIGGMAPPSTPAKKFADLNTLLGIPLLVDATLWDDSPADVARRLKLPLEGKTDRFEGYRSYPNPPRSILGADARMLSLQAAESRITALTIQFTNRGDYPGFKFDDERMTPSKQEIQTFEQVLKQDFDTLTATLTAKLGAPKREVAVGGLDPGRRSLRWEWDSLVLLLNYDELQMVSLKIIPAARVAVAPVSDAQIRQLFKDRIARRPNGDVILDQIPMVNQGPKGYCVPATFERYLRYAGIPADMYELAASGGTQFGGGSSFETMTHSLDRFVRRQGRRLEPVSIKLTAVTVARYIDEGRPLIWGLYSTESFNALADANTEARQKSADAPPSKISLTPAELASFKIDPRTAHACLIIGYNRATGEIALSDSWGPKFRERWVPAAVAQKISQDEYWVLAW